MNRYETLKLENQLCFPLYATAKEVVRRYGPFLAELDITYTQYIALMVLWEQNGISVKALGERLFLDSGTLTPLLKKMEGRGLLTRTRDRTDERSVRVTLTEAGFALRERALTVPERLFTCLPIELDDAKALQGILKRMLSAFAEAPDEPVACPKTVADPE